MNVKDKIKLLDSINRDSEEIRLMYDKIRSIMEETKKKLFSLSKSELMDLFDSTEIVDRILHDSIHEYIKEKYPKEFKLWLYENGRHKDLRYFILKKEN